MNDPRRFSTPSPPPLLADGAALQSALNDAAGEDLWIDVIRQMDTVYADLVTSQTALEEQHRELGEAHDLINSVLEGMTDLVVACGRDGRIERVNNALMNTVGATAKELVGRPVGELFATEERVSLEASLAQVRAGESVDQREWHLIAGDGTLAAISANIAPRHDGSGDFAGLVLVSRPLGELQRAYLELDDAHRTLKRTQEQLLLSEKMAALGRLVAGVAHELNNPISFVFGNMYSLKRYGESLSEYLGALDASGTSPELDDMRQRLRIDRILEDIGPLVEGTLEGAERVRDIVQELRRFSSNQQEQPECFNLVRLVQTACDWVVKAQREAPRVQFDMPDTLDIVTLKGQLHQILVNLIQNACDAVSAVSIAVVSITVRAEGDMVAIEVTDNGHGIDPKNRDKIFEPFFTTKPIGSGTGLGLYVSYSMAGKIGGTLRFSDNPAGGTCFTLRLPKGSQETLA